MAFLPKFACFFLLIPGLSLRADVPPDYDGKPFDDAAYRAQQDVLSDAKPEPRDVFTPALVAWDSKTPAHGSGWVGKTEAGASIALDDKNADGEHLIHYHNAGSGHFSIFGWLWATPQEQAVDLRQFDAISFAIKISGPQKLQELYFGVTEHNPTPVSLRKYDSDFANGMWHTITIPLGDLKWNSHGLPTDMTEARGCLFMTYLWEKSNYDIRLDHFIFDRTKSPASPTVKAAPPGVEKGVAATGQTIPGKVECAFFDQGGEGVAYHDADAINTLSGVLNQQKTHQRPKAAPYHWNFRKDEGVDLSYTKDFADFSHPNLFEPPVNQLYIGGASDGEWCNYTVNVKQAGSYRIIALYGNAANTFDFAINHKPVCTCKFPLATGSMHKWNKAAVGTITFPEAGTQLLTFSYNKGNNFAYFEFEPAH